MCACFYLHTLCLPCTFSYPCTNWTKATALLRWFATQFVFLRKFLFNYVRWNKIIAFRFPRCSAWLKINTVITGSFLPQPLHCVTASRIVTGKSINCLEVCVHAPFLLNLMASVVGGFSLLVAGVGEGWVTEAVLGGLVSGWVIICCAIVKIIQSVTNDIGGFFFDCINTYSLPNGTF